MTIEDVIANYKAKMKNRRLHFSEKLLLGEVISALEKQIPKKPIGDLGSVPHYRCPYCNRAVKLYKNDRGFDFCPDCGQKIDWSDDNDS